MNIVISDVNFLINCPGALLRSDDHPETYAAFMNCPTTPDKEHVGVDVGVEIENFPITDKSWRIFEAVDSWSMFRKGEEYLMALKPSLPGGPVCLARFDRLIERVAIHCGKALVRSASGGKAVMNPIRYPVDQLLLMYVLARREGAIFHAASVTIGGKGYIFPGRSGAGKTTISRNLALRGHEVLSDDRAVVRKIKGEFRVFGTPWAGEGGMAENKDFPLGGICFIQQNKGNTIREMTPAEAVERLMPVTSIPWYDQPSMEGILSFCEDMATEIPAYMFSLEPTVEAVRLFEGIISS